MLFRFLELRQQFKDGQELSEDPVKSAKKFLQSLFIRYIASAGITILALLVFLGFLGYGNILQGPYAFARVLFWILIVLALFGTLAITAIIVSVQRVIKSQHNTRQQPRGTIIDVDPD